MSDYRLARALGVRLVGGLLVLVAVLVLAATLLSGLPGLSGWLPVAVAVIGLLAAGTAAYVVTRRVAVVRLDAAGYRVRLVRGAGVPSAGWKEVEEAVTTRSAAGEPVLQLRLKDGRSTTIPVRALEADREEFVRDLLEHLRRGQGIRPL